MNQNNPDASVSLSPASSWVQFVVLWWFLLWFWSNDVSVVILCWLEDHPLLHTTRELAATLCFDLSNLLLAVLQYNHFSEHYMSNFSSATELVKLFKIMFQF